MTETTLRTMVADDIGMGPLAVAERAAVRAILSDLRDRRLLKYLFSDNPDNVGAYGYVEAPIDLQTQHDMVTKWVRLASQSLSTDGEAAITLAPAMMLECVESGVWSLQFRFGTGDEACKSMRHAADAVRKLKERSCPITAKDAASSGTAASATTDEEVRRLREALRACTDALTKHHQWHAAQTDPDPEHGFIPADEYADSQLYEQTVEAAALANPLLADGPVNTAALQSKDTPSHGG